MNKNKVILHVDDDPQMLRIVSERLGRKGFEIVSLNDPNQALNALLNNDYRVVLLDIEMPGINGLDLLNRIKEQDGGIQVIMVTGLVTMTTVLESMRRGAEACLFKPIEDFSNMAHVISRTFEKLDRWWDALEELTTRR